MIIIYIRQCFDLFILVCNVYSSYWHLNCIHMLPHNQLPCTMCQLQGFDCILTSKYYIFCSSAKVRVLCNISGCKIIVKVTYYYKICRLIDRFCLHFSLNGCWTKNLVTSLNRSLETKYLNTSVVHFWVSTNFCAWKKIHLL